MLYMYFPYEFTLNIWTFKCKWNIEIICFVYLRVGGLCLVLSCLVFFRYYTIACSMLSYLSKQNKVLRPEQICTVTVFIHFTRQIDRLYKTVARWDLSSQAAPDLLGSVPWCFFAHCPPPPLPSRDRHIDKYVRVLFLVPIQLLASPLNENKMRPQESPSLAPSLFALASFIALV